MIENELNSTIVDFYNGSKILITGGTGFMGRILIDKLLRVCKGLEQIYLIIRIKKGKDAATRLKELFEDPIFEQLKKECPDFRSKITCIPGDCSSPGLNLHENDFRLLTNEITHVFHVAANVRFDEKLKDAINVNVRGIKEIIKFCKMCTRLKAIVHVSTAYANCPRSTVEEEFYKPPITGDNALALTKIFDDSKLESITKDIIKPWPNTYSFTKAIAESVVKEEADGLPIAVFRPSIVIGTSEGPIKGWINNLYGPTGVVVGVGAGLLRVLHADEHMIADLVPVDMAVNALICTSWDVHNKFNNNVRALQPNLSENTTTEQFNDMNFAPSVYNYVMSPKNSLTWGQFLYINFKHGQQAPTIKAVWYYTLTLTRVRLLYNFLILFYHLIPALLIDGCLKLAGKKPQMWSAYQKIHKFANVIAYFATNKWDFRDGNTQTLWSKLNINEQKLFNFDMRSLDWDTFFKHNVNGVRTYLFQDDPKTIPAARRKMFLLHVAHRFVQLCLLAFGFWFIRFTLTTFGNSPTGIFKTSLMDQSISK